MRGLSPERLAWDWDRWIRERALPLWLGAGWDEGSSMFVERLDLSGRPLSEAPRRAMVQARQTFVCAVAARRGWAPPARALAGRAAATLVERFWAADGAEGFVFSLNRRGEIVDARRDLYAQAFGLLAMASAAEATGDDAFLDHAARVADWLDAELSSPHGGYAESAPPAPGPRRQNPHMHLFEAFLALHAVDPERGWLDRARTLHGLLLTRFVVGDDPTLCEFFTEDWRPDEAPLGFEPGHHFEWAWLLRRFAVLAGEAPPPIAENLAGRALQFGFSPEGLVYDRVSAGGVPLSRSTRLWPMAEAARALSTGPVDVTSSTAVLAVLARRFLAPAHPGTWIDHFDESGRALVDFAPASSLYHIVGALDCLEPKSPA